MFKRFSGDITRHLNLQVEFENYTDRSKLNTSEIFELFACTAVLVELS